MERSPQKVNQASVMFKWSGTFSSGGDEISGKWELTDGDGAGTWSGSLGEA